MAVKQGNQLQMQVHEGYRVVYEAPPPVGAEKRPVARTGKKPLAHYSSLVRVLGSDMKTPEEPAAQQFPPAPRDADQPQDKPPDWFTSYLETVSVLSGLGFSGSVGTGGMWKKQKAKSRWLLPLVQVNEE
ncbi:next to BRCA1 gene 1 protein-like [Delphinapterus leucas]|uniref:Next to BRCA1 gene 1 protein-like n=1 Tax=Delphinapterus leucas TaxID=9749 RepID=A0A2Y9N002_DELLE|nr:next to BRCA1 gene 1 protein-like [Delphinapterus leucas]